MNIMSIRSRPRWQLVKLLRDAGVKQYEIAARIGVTQSYVSRVLSRTASVRPSDKTEAVWREVAKVIEKALA